MGISSIIIKYVIFYTPKQVFSQINALHLAIKRRHFMAAKNAYSEGCFLWIDRVTVTRVRSKMGVDPSGESWLKGRTALDDCGFLQ
jgi:hypothetical protein